MQLQTTPHPPSPTPAPTPKISSKSDWFKNEFELNFGVGAGVGEGGFVSGGNLLIIGTTRGLLSQEALHDRAYH
eukprot:6477757-Amphidinium_carterae.1